MARLLMLTGLLLVVGLVFAAKASSIAPPAPVSQVLAQERAAGTSEPISRQARIAVVRQDSPETADDALVAVQESTPVPTETPELPPETTSPTPGETSEPEPTATNTPEPGETVEPVPTEPAAVTATAAATGTPATLIWPPDWPLGTIQFGPEETGPPVEPMRIMMDEWLRLALAVVVVGLVASLGGRLLFRLLKAILARRLPGVDEALWLELRPLLSWWLGAIGFHLAIRWVSFQNERAIVLFTDLAFFAYLGVATLTMWRLVDQAIDLYAKRMESQGQAAAAQRLRPLMHRWARVLILVFSFLVGLGRLQGGFSMPSILVLLIGLTISLAARDTLTDIIAGFFILIDQPFRIGDRIEIQGVETWATVASIGLRTSVLLTRHNVEVIVPNSKIGKNQVINYSYPDPRYRMQTDVGIAFGTNVEYARQVLIDAVRRVECVLPDEPVQALYAEIGDSAMNFRVRWWIDFHQDWERAYDRIHTAMRKALAEAGIESPYPSRSLNLEVDDQTLAEVWQAWQGEGEKELTE